MRYDKLVRDNIPEYIRHRGGVPKTHIAGEDEFEAKLNAKLLEEAEEFLKADPEKRAEELADILEVIAELKEFYGLSEENINKIKKEKLEERGGFKKRIILEES